MKYANLGNTGLMVSRLSFGAMTFGEGTLVGELKTTLGQKDANEMVAASLDAGINLFDTADMYTNGQSEEILGRALKEKRQSAVIATKCGFRSGPSITDCGLSYRYVLSAVERSLKRLGTDYIDLFQLHIPDPHTPHEETARALEEAVRKGWVRYTGFCNYQAWEAQAFVDTQKRRGDTPFSSAQMYYSLLGRDLESEFVPFLQKNELGLLVWSPLASGFLTGKYTRENPVPADARRAKFDFPPINVEKGYEVVGAMREIAGELDASVPQIALAWLLSKSYVSSVIIGASKMSQLKDNLGAVNVELNPAQISRLDEISAIALPYPAWMGPMGRDEQVTEGLS